MHGICEKCELGNGFLVRLQGGVATILCPVCTTEWHKLIGDHKSLLKTDWASAVMQNVIQNGALIVTDPNHIYSRARSLHSKHSNVLFDLALEWLGRK